MAMPNKKKENCLDQLAKQFGSIDILSMDIISRNIIRVIKDIAYGNISRDDFEKYKLFFTNRQNVLAFKEFTNNRNNIAAMYVTICDVAMHCDHAPTPVVPPQQLQPQPSQQQPTMYYQTAMPQQPCNNNQLQNRSLFGSLTGFTPVMQPYQTAMPIQPQVPVQIVNSPVMDIPQYIGNPCNLNNGLFAQIRDVEIRKHNLWNYISSFYNFIDLNYDMFVNNFVNIYGGFQTNLNNNFRKDFMLLDK